MGVSTNGEISFGYLFEEGYEFPWGDDFEKWWMFKVCGYKNPFEIYDEKGEYLHGIKPSEELARVYYDTYRRFLESHPIPVEMVNVCSGDCPIYILAVPDSGHRANRGYPKSFDPLKLTVDENKVKELAEFCKKFDIKVETPRWYLSSYWG